MALTPWHVASRISCDDAASLLAGFDISAAKAGLIGDHEIEEYKEWHKVLMHAAKLEKIKPCFVGVWRDGRLEPPDDDALSWQHLYDHVLSLSFEREEIYRWLKESGVSDEDVPEALRVIPKPKQAGGDNELHPKKETTYQRIIAALIALQYGHREVEQPYPLADELLDDCQFKGFQAPASRSTLGPIFEKLPPVQKANPD